MAISPARKAAFEILLRVTQEASYASELLHADDMEKLSAADHRLATELVMGVLRWQSALDAIIAAHSSKKLRELDVPVLIALRLGIYQLSFLDRIPPHAAIHESVELVKQSAKKSGAPFVNAVLRKSSTQAKRTLEPRSSAATAAELSRAWAHPQWMVERWLREFGAEAAAAICEYDQRQPDTSLHISNEKVLDEIQRDGITLAPGLLVTSARRVANGDVQQTPAVRDGRVSIQDEASQLVAMLAGHGGKILDCCAAPGGKTRILAERNPMASIVALELHPHRARLLRQRVRNSNVEVKTGDIAQLPGAGDFDVVLVDVPCSGTGTLARNPEIKWRLTANDLADLQQRQLTILNSAMKHVAAGGRLVYSTCSMETEENVAVVEKAMAVHPTFALVDSRKELERLRASGDLAWPSIDSLVRGQNLRTTPGIHRCDGFFAAILGNRE